MSIDALEVQESMPELDGGAAASGLNDPRLSHDPTQGAGTSAWQLAQKHSAELNARNRRN